MEKETDEEFLTKKRRKVAGAGAQSDEPNVFKIEQDDEIWKRMRLDCWISKAKMEGISGKIINKCRLSEEDLFMYCCQTNLTKNKELERGINDKQLGLFLGYMLHKYAGNATLAASGMVEDGEEMSILLMETWSNKEEE